MVYALSRNFRFELLFRPQAYASSPIDSSADHRGLFGVASRLVLAVPLTSLICFPPPPCLAADTCLHWMTSAPLGFHFCFATRPAAATLRSASACCRTAVQGLLKVRLGQGLTWIHSSGPPGVPFSRRISGLPRPALTVCANPPVFRNAGEADLGEPSRAKNSYG